MRGATSKAPTAPAVYVNRTYRINNNLVRQLELYSFVKKVPMSRVVEQGITEVLRAAKFNPDHIQLPA
jgi:hypothetical protein